MNSHYSSAEQAKQYTHMHTHRNLSRKAQIENVPILIWFIILPEVSTSMF